MRRIDDFAKRIAGPYIIEPIQKTLRISGCGSAPFCQIYTYIKNRSKVFDRDVPLMSTTSVVRRHESNGSQATETYLF